MVFANLTRLNPLCRAKRFWYAVFTSVCQLSVSDGPNRNAVALRVVSPLAKGERESEGRLKALLNVPTPRLHPLSLCKERGDRSAIRDCTASAITLRGRVAVY